MRTRPPGSPGRRRPPSGRWQGSFSWTWPGARRGSARRLADSPDQPALLDEPYALPELPKPRADDARADAATLDEITELAE